MLVGGAICKSGYTQRVMRRDAEQPGVETDFLALDSSTNTIGPAADELF